MFSLIRSYKMGTNHSKLFYYIEVWDKKIWLKKKLKKIIDVDDITTPYFLTARNSFSSNIQIIENIYEALFYKKYTTIKTRLEQIDDKYNHKYKFILKTLDVDEFLEGIPDTVRVVSDYYLRNRKLKRLEEVRISRNRSNDYTEKDLKKILK